MRNLIISGLFFTIALCNIYSQDSIRVFRFYDEKATVMPEGNIRYSLLGKLEYGINENLEISAHPILLFLSPTIDLKYNFYKKDDLTISSIHGINYPSILLNLVAKKGTGGFISAEFDIPQMISIHNGIIVTSKLNDKNYFTGKLSFEFALNNSKLEPGTSIDMPVILPRMMVYYQNVGFDLSLISEGKIYRSFDYHAKAEMFLFPFESDAYSKEYPDNSSNYFMEFSGTAFWNLVQSAKIGIGGRLCYGAYPFGGQWHLIPMIDFVKYIE